MENAMPDDILPPEETQVTFGEGYKNTKSTTQYTPDTAPIAYTQENQSHRRSSKPAMKKKDTMASTNGDDHVVMVDNRAAIISKGFLDSLIRIIISGQHPQRGSSLFKVKDVIRLIVSNTGRYRVVVDESFKSKCVIIIQNGDEALLGKAVTPSERDRIVAQFKKDYNIT
jgi:hypothetical protein